MTLLSLLDQGCSQSLPGLHQVPHDPRQRPDDGDPPTGSGALQVNVEIFPVSPLQSQVYPTFQFDNERPRIPG